MHIFYLLAAEPIMVGLRHLAGACEVEDAGRMVFTVLR